MFVDVHSIQELCQLLYTIEQDHAWSDATKLPQSLGHVRPTGFKLIWQRRWIQACASTDRKESCVGGGGGGGGAGTDRNNSCCVVVARVLVGNGGGIREGC